MGSGRQNIPMKSNGWTYRQANDEETLDQWMRVIFSPVSSLSPFPAICGWLHSEWPGRWFAKVIICSQSIMYFTGPFRHKMWESCNVWRQRLCEMVRSQERDHRYVEKCFNTDEMIDRWRKKGERNRESERGWEKEINESANEIQRLKEVDS